ncbi:MAG: hypothetical protein Q9218_003641 [Villophora microphyllina]
MEDEEFQNTNPEYKRFLYLRAREKDLGAWERYFEQAVKDAEKMNKALSRMDKGILDDVLVGKMHTALKGEDILKVACARKYGFLHRFWKLPSVFQGREYQVPVRAVAWAKMMWQDFYMCVLDIGEGEKQVWIEHAKKVLGRDEIPLKEGLK